MDTLTYYQSVISSEFTLIWGRYYKREYVSPSCTVQMLIMQETYQYDVTRTVIVSGFILKMSSNNAYYDNLAKEGDLITIQLVSDQYINSSITNATILGRITNDTSVIGNTIYANTTVLDSDANGNIEFSIIVNPVSGPSEPFTHHDLTSANVVVDFIAPTSFL